MKKITILVAVLLTCSLNAQITITSDDIVGIGKIIEEAGDNNPDQSIKPGSAGINQTWDFSALSADETEYLYTLNPDWTPYSSFFPGSNIAFFSTRDSIYMFMEKTTSAFSMHGIYGTIMDSIDLPIVYTPPIVMAEFPVQYGNHKDGNSSFTFFMPITGVPSVDSAKLKMDVIQTTDVDAWGTVTTPLGTFQALRTLTYEESTDSIWFRMGGVWTFYTGGKDATNTYSWWTDDNATGYILVKFDYDAAHDSVSSVEYLASSPTQAISEKDQDTEINIYPNPAKDFLYIDSNAESIAEIELFDNYGRLILAAKISANELNKISVKDYPPGIYFYSIIGNNKSILGKGKFFKE